MSKNGFIIFLVAFVATAATPLSALEREPLSTPDGTTVERFTLGGAVQGATPIYQYQDTVTADIDQKEILVNIQYPNPQAVDQSVDNGGAVITSVSLYLVGSEGFTSQALTTSGGIGERSITLQVVASNTETLRYIVIIEGLKG